MAEIEIVCKMGSFIHVFKCISAKIAGKIRLLLHESETIFNPDEIFIRRDLSILNSISHLTRIDFEVSFGIETQSGFM